MYNDFQQSFIDLKTTIEQRQFEKLSNFSLGVPERFNWMRDVFSSIIVKANAHRNLLELVTDEDATSFTLTYEEALEKCNQLLNFLRNQGVQQGDRVFIMCGLHEGLWLSYLAA